MNVMRIAVEKVQGGIGTDAWQASLALDDDRCAVKVTGRGETREQARSALRNALTMLVRETNQVITEL
jgi:IS1 family transposase